MAKKHYAEVAGNYKKFAEVLSAEANEIEGMAGLDLMILQSVAG
jgi:hypothetical protein